MLNLRINIIITIFIVLNISLNGQSINYLNIVPIDSNVRIGKLDNGLTYYIRNNHKPENRVYMNLIIKAGSIYEEDNQKGYAHFIEHMAFKQTVHFKTNEIVNVLEKMGSKFGAEVNAHTGFNETVYNLEIPSDKSDLIEKGFLILEDWAHNIVLDDKEVNKEKGVINEEARIGRGNDRVTKKFLPILLKGSKYPDRIPIGNQYCVNNCNSKTLMDFYKDWYRPDLMGIIIVGDIDVNLAESKIREHFSEIKNPINIKKAENYEIPDNKEPLIAIITDKEQPNTMINIFYKHNLENQKYLGNYKKLLLQDIFIRIINERLQESAFKSDASIVDAKAKYDKFFSNNKNAFTLSAISKENEINNSLILLFSECEKIIQNGCTESEIDRQKEYFQNAYEIAASEIDKTESSLFLQQYLNNFLYGDFIPGAKNELKYLNSIVHSIITFDINQAASDLIKDDNICILVIAPALPGINIPTSTDITDLYQSVKTTKFIKYVDKEQESSLMFAKPNDSKVLSCIENSLFGYSELNFENGVKAILMPTKNQNEQILFSSYKLGGTSLYPDSLVLAALYSAEIVSESGAGHYSKNELDKKLTGKIVKLSPYIDELKQGTKGIASKKDFETLLQLNYLYYNEPRKDQYSFDNFISKIRENAKNMLSNAEYSYFDTLIKLSSSSRNIIFPRLKKLDKLKLEDTYRIYKERFSDAGGTTFFIVGSFKVDEIIPLLEKYLGGLPSTNKIESWKDVNSKFPPGINEVTIYKGYANRSLSTLIMKNKFDWNYKNVLGYKILLDIMEIKLMQTMRSDRSMVYNLTVNGQENLIPKPECFVTFFWLCDPLNVSTLNKILFKEIRKIQRNGPDKETLAKVKENYIKEREKNINENSFWLSKLEDLYYEKIELINFEDYRKKINDITEEDIKLLAQKYLTLDHYVSVVLKPDRSFNFYR